MNAGQPWEIVEASFTAAATSLASLPAATRAEIAFAGRSNVGKSSLMNALMGRRRLVRTSSTPGCTRAIALFEARARDGEVITMVDLPGYGFAKRSKAERSAWGKMVEGYLEAREALRVVALLVDARRGAADEERQLVEYLAAKRGTEVPVLLVATKIDRIAKSKQRAALAKLGRGRAFGVSGTTGEGTDALWRALRGALRSES